MTFEPCRTPEHRLIPYDLGSTGSVSLYQCGRHRPVADDLLPVCLGVQPQFNGHDANRTCPTLRPGLREPLRPGLKQLVATGSEPKRKSPGVSKLCPTLFVLRIFYQCRVDYQSRKDFPNARTIPDFVESVKFDTHSIPPGFHRLDDGLGVARAEIEIVPIRPTYRHGTNLHLFLPMRQQDPDALTRPTDGPRCETLPPWTEQSVPPGSTSPEDAAHRRLPSIQRRMFLSSPASASISFVPSSYRSLALRRQLFVLPCQPINQPSVQLVFSEAGSHIFNPSIGSPVLSIARQLRDWNYL